MTCIVRFLFDQENILSVKFIKAKINSQHILKCLYYFILSYFFRNLKLSNKHALYNNIDR